MSFEDRFVEPATAGKTLNVVLYGPPGAGKSTGALSAPGPILYLAAEGPNAITFARGLHPEKQIFEAPLTGRDVLDEAYLWVRDERKVATVVVDSLSEMHAAVLRSVAKDDRHPSLPERGDCNMIVERFLLALRDLPVNVVVVCHETTLKDDVAGTVERSINPGTSNVALAQKIMGVFADVLAYCGRVEDENGNESFVAQVVDGNGRRAKNRGGHLGKVAPLALDQWLVNTDKEGSK